MKTSEAWEMLANTLEDWGMPPLNEKEQCLGLCECILFMHQDRFITYEQRKSMISQLYRRFYKKRAYLWPEGKVKPRIKACRILAEESK